MNGVWYVSKTIAPYWAGGASTLSRKSNFSVVPIKMKYAWFSYGLGFCGKRVQNGGKEHRIPYNDGKWFFIDAWDEETNTVYEFHGTFETIQRI